MPVLTDATKSLPFNRTQHKVATNDAQPSSDSGGILVMVTGALLVRDSLHIKRSTVIRLYTKS